MKKIMLKLQSAADWARAVHGKPIEAGILDIDLRSAQPVKVNRSLATTALKKLNTPKNRRLAAALLGAAAVTSAAHSVGRYRFYRSAVAREMKKQLEPLQTQIAALQDSVDALRAENAAMRGETVPELEETPKQHRKRGK